MFVYGISIPTSSITELATRNVSPVIIPLGHRRA